MIETSTHIYWSCNTGRFTDSTMPSDRTQPENTELIYLIKLSLFQWHCNLMTYANLLENQESRKRLGDIGWHMLQYI
jgi:hypothetical protein